MNPFRWPAVAAMAILLAFATSALAQPFPPRVGYAFPAGGRQGTTVQVMLGGQRLEGVSTVYISGTGVQAKVLEYAKPLTPKQAGDLRDKVQELQKKEKDAEVRKELADIRAKLMAFRNKAGPSLAELLTLQVTLAPDAAPGERELRVGTPNGMSNPIVFCVGQLPEFVGEAPKRSETPGAGAEFGAAPRERPPAPPRPDRTVTLPVILNGQIMPGSVDRYRFKAVKGQRLVVSAKARELIPYLADAVPGWFQATLAIYDAQGREVAYCDDFRFHPDPLLLFQPPANGEYVLEIRDAIWRGREDFVYRIAVGELPLLTGIFPLGGKAGSPTTVELTGWNLPVARLTQEGLAPGIHQVSVRQGDLVSNREPFMVDTLPECLEKEPNSDAASAQQVTLPIVVNGRIDKPGDWDVFRFEGKAGDEVVAEVYARRLDSPLDSVIRLTDSGGKQVAMNDDHEDKGTGLNTHHADSYLRTALPASGTYTLHLGDAQHHGGPEYAYRLRLSVPRPDFDLRVTPSSVTVRGGATVPLGVYVLRKDGFAGEISLALKGAPAGFALAGAKVPAGLDQVRVTLTAPAIPPKEPVALYIEGRATVQGQEVVRQAIPAEDMMQAFAYHHLVPAEEMKVAVTGRSVNRPGVRILGAAPLRIPAGGTAKVQASVPPTPAFENLTFELSDPPAGLTVQNVVAGRDSTDIVLQGDAAKAKPGLKGNLIVNIYGTRIRPPEKAAAPAQRLLLDTLPALPFEIVAP